MESITRPSLVDPIHFITPPPIIKPKKYNLNIIILVLFVIFMCVFFYISKYKTSPVIDVIPFNLYEKY